MATDGAKLLRLANWLSPAFPVGGFAYSAGMEQAIHEGAVCNAADLADWLSGLLGHGSLWNDAVLLAASWRGQGDAGALADLAALGLALSGSAERHQEIMILGDAFLRAAGAWPHPVLARLPAVTPYAVAVGAVAGAHDVGLHDTLSLYLNAAINQSCSVAIRCGLIGQTAALGVVAGLEQDIVRISRQAGEGDLSALGGFSLRADILAMNHETLNSRLFRS